MKKIIGILTIGGFAILLSSCNNNKEVISSLEKQLSFGKIKLALSNSRDQNNAISKIDRSSTTTQITFEGGETFSIDNNQIDRIENDSTNWLTTFYFTDATAVSSYFIGNLSILTSDVIVDPYEKCPLSAIAKIQTPIKGSFKVIVHGKGINGVAISKTFNNFGYSHEIPILGLYQDYANQVEFVFINQSGKVRTSKTVAIATDPIPKSPTIKINTNNLGVDYNGIFMVTSLRLGFDQMGEVRWCFTPDSSPHFSFMSKLINGNMIAVSPNGTSFIEQTMFGQTIKTYKVPDGIHHDIIEMPSGNFLVTSNSNNGISIEDLMIEIDRASGSIVKTWDLYKILDPFRKALPDTEPNDWLHMNSLFYDTSDKSIIFSGRSQSAVVKIDYATGAPKWILGTPNFWNESLSKYLLTPVNAAGQPLDVSLQDFWPYGQHAASRLPNGNILMYDDGDYRGFYDNQSVPKISYSRAVEYAIDEQAKTIKLVWEFNNNKSIFTPYTGFVQQLTSSSRVIAYMDGHYGNLNTPKIVEIDNANQIKFEADINSGLKSFYYRSWKVDLYQGIK